ncbi:hypothetical protein TNCT_194051 [Trichonephila clavata]|uniref:Endonuclease/exonuclease/phosphatase domain-containing protein n=1 Tax=Trichonephila clavata TaxID=2740835 RepID=A0A8X6JLM3_TRICU|nr:hypothetical protein TNCT_194051 [Trichonephila clavata]
MEDPVDDHCLNMEGVGVPPPSQMMKDVLNSKVLKRHPRPIAGNNVELKSLDVKIFIEGIEVTLITLTPTDQEPLLVASICIPPNNKYFKNIGPALYNIFNINNIAILAGDFNAKQPREVALSATPEVTDFTTTSLIIISTSSHPSSQLDMVMLHL